MGGTSEGRGGGRWVGVIGMEGFKVNGKEGERGTHTLHTLGRTRGRCAIRGGERGGQAWLALPKDPEAKGTLCVWRRKAEAHTQRTRAQAAKPKGFRPTAHTGRQGLLCSRPASLTSGQRVRSFRFSARPCNGVACNLDGSAMAQWISGQWDRQMHVCTAPPPPIPSPLSLSPCIAPLCTRFVVPNL